MRPVLSQLNPAHTFIPHSFIIYFNIIFSISKSPKIKFCRHFLSVAFKLLERRLRNGIDVIFHKVLKLEDEGFLATPQTLKL
jgi:hypothetical protein